MVEKTQKYQVIYIFTNLTIFRWCIEQGLVITYKSTGSSSSSKLEYLIFSYKGVLGARFLGSGVPPGPMDCLFVAGREGAAREKSGAKRAPGPASPQATRAGLSPGG